MLLDTTPTLLDEVAATEERFQRNEARSIRDLGAGATAGGAALTNRFTKKLSEGFVTILSKKQRRGSVDERVARLLKALDPDVLAVCTLQTVLHSIARDKSSVVQLCRHLSRAVQGELWGLHLSKHDAKLSERIERNVRMKHGSVRYRRQAARSIAKRAGFSWTAQWTSEEAIQVGQFILNALLEALPEMFEYVHTHNSSTILTISDTATGIARQAQLEAMRQNPVFLPQPVAPTPWTDWNRGGPADKRMQRSATLIRSHRREVAGMVRAAIRSGQMQPTLDALNAIQNTAWRVNRRVLAVLKDCVEQGIPVPGLPRLTDYPTPVKDKPWEEMEALEKTLWKIKATDISKANLGLKSERMRMQEDLEVADQMAQHARFWTPCNLDWRGRVYPLPYFNFQRDDRVRGLFEFADGEAIGEEGLYWLKIHTANCGDFEKVSKRPFSDRIAWIDANIDWIQSTAINPFDNTKWREADKPFLFLAACLELSDALAQGPGYVSHLPVNWDGSCSGLQHLCAMTRAPEGAYVNLTPQEQPQDVYQRVADTVSTAILDDLIGSDEKRKRYATLCNRFGINRKVVKRNVMTFSYSSKTFGMAQQQVEDLMEPLKLKVLSGDLEEHPFGQDSGYGASKYLAKHVYDAIESTVRLPASAMGFLQTLAKALAHECKPLSWVTPTGLPWVNRYHEVTTKRVQLWLHDRGVSVPHKAVVAVGEDKKIDKDKAAQGVAPNFVHACDAAHLLLTVLAASREGFGSFALVHDSFGCHASRAARFHRIIREQFVQMYETHDVLNEVLERAKCDLTYHNSDRLPPSVPKGDLNIKEVLNAPYAFA